MRRRRFLAALGAPIVAGGLSAAAAGATDVPDRIPLPDGFQPEGVAIGPGPFGYFGSLANGDIYRANLHSGAGTIISKGPGTPSVGMKTDSRGRLYVAGRDAGTGRVVDTRTGEILASFRFATGDTFINDVLLTRGEAYFTDSRRPSLYRLTEHGQSEIDLRGDVEYGEGINCNGIATTPDGAALLLVQSNKGLLYRVDRGSGIGRTVDLGGESLVNGDGLLRHGRTLYVVQNRPNQVAVLRLNGSGTSGRLVKHIADDSFDVPTTVASFAGRLYLPNARFGTDPTPKTEYWATIVQL